MKILFTKSIWPASWMIRQVTGEDCSHCAIQIGDIVCHVNFTGFHVEPEADFLKSSTIVHSVELPITYDLGDLVHKFYDVKYDFGAMFYLMFKCMFPFLPSRNLWQSTGMMLCSEFVSDIVEGYEDSQVTPYVLFQKLSNLKG